MGVASRQETLPHSDTNIVHVVWSHLGLAYVLLLETISPFCPEFLDFQLEPALVLLSYRTLPMHARLDASC